MDLTERTRKLELARTMVTQLEDGLASGAGIFMVQMDGTMVQFERANALKELQHWRKEVTRYAKKQSRFSSINLGNSS